MDRYFRPDADELQSRRERLFRELDQTAPDWDTALITSPTNLYYFTGTKQDSILVMKRDGSAVLFVRRSFERAKEESAFPDIRPMHSYAQAAARFGSSLGVTVLEKERVSLQMLDRMNNHFQFGRIRAVEPALDEVRAVKSPFELEIMRACGKIHGKLLKEVVPELLTEGISECEFYSSLMERAVAMGHQGETHFNSAFSFVECCQYGFGENTLLPTSFDSPCGMRGMYPAIPGGGSRERRLKPGDLVVVDFGCGLGGYQTDMTQVYCYHGTPSDEALAAHERCREICLKAAAMLKPGAIPRQIYEASVPTEDSRFMKNFMGMGEHGVQFLGHSIGMDIDERPAIARAFTKPLKANMTFALEPKKGIPGQGFVGVEDTFLVTEAGSECLTGGPSDIIIV